jgi:hypothetical protein
MLTNVWDPLLAENQAVLEKLEQSVPEKLSPEMRNAFYAYLFTEVNGRYPNADRLCLTVNGAVPFCPVDVAVYAEIRKEASGKSPATPSGLKDWEQNPLVIQNKDVLARLEQKSGKSLAPDVKEALYKYLFTPDENGRYRASKLCLPTGELTWRCGPSQKDYDEIVAEVSKKVDVQAQANPSSNGWEQNPLVIENKGAFEYLEKKSGTSLSPATKEALYKYVFTPDENGRYPHAADLCLSINGQRRRCPPNEKVYAEIIAKISKS